MSPAEDSSELEGAPVEGKFGLLADSEFSLAESVGGVRGLIESTAPGLVFVIIFVITRDLQPALIGSLAIAAIATIARLIQRTPFTQAIGGVIGVGVGAIWAHTSGAAEDFFAPGLVINAAYLVAMIVSILSRWPVVGIIMGLLTQEQKTWRTNPQLLRRYQWATSLWAGMFAIRLAVQLPLYLNAEAAWLGTARLVMGVPLWALVLWLTWVMAGTKATAKLRGLSAPEKLAE